jgi:hypothetical protein
VEKKLRKIVNWSLFKGKIMIKKDAIALIEKLPDDATWDDISYAIHVRIGIEQGLQDAREGRLTSVEDVRKKYGIKK